MNTRSADGWATPHKAGAALVAMRGDRPVLPVHLGGTARIIPREGGLHPGRTAVTFGRPMSLARPRSPRIRGADRDRGCRALRRAGDRLVGGAAARRLPGRIVTAANYGDMEGGYYGPAVAFRSQTSTSAGRPRRASPIVRLVTERDTLSGVGGCAST